MRVFLTGVGCVGKTSIGAILASRLGCRFYDLDLEIEGFFKTSIERLRNGFLTVESFRNEAARVLMHILGHPESRNCVIALPPSGLMGRYLRVLKRAGGTIVVLTDKPENILNRITFYDIDSRPILKSSQKERSCFTCKKSRRTSPIIEKATIGPASRLTYPVCLLRPRQRRCSNRL
jgi:shikimate kinase